MGIIQNIKDYFYKLNIKRASAVVAKVPREIINLNKAKSVGVLFDASETNNVIEVTQFADKLTSLGKNVKLLAYIDNNEKENQDPKFFNNTDVNWYNIPKGEKVTSFQTTKLDILIIALTKECAPVEYLAATSKAKFRVGSYFKNNMVKYELMINTKQNQQLNYLLQQIFHFINVINK